MPTLAIIGAGISGLGAAYALHEAYDITLYEKRARLGGHSRTVQVNTSAGTTAVDTGFIVYNTLNYPNLTALFNQLDVITTPSDMSFAACVRHQGSPYLEYATHSVSGLFAGGRNASNPMFWRMLADIIRFHKAAPRFLDATPDLTLGDLLKRLKMSRWFCDYYLLAMGAAIWSMSRQQMLDFPARTLLQFFDNHRLMQLTNQPQWRTVQGGSIQYVHKLRDACCATIRTEHAATRIIRTEHGVIVEDASGQQQHYDHVLLACHSDEALALLDAPTPQEQAILGAIRYADNTVILHADTSFMPANKATWASWVYLLERHEKEPRACLSYWMNRLQPLDTATPLVVTLNPHTPPPPELTFNTTTLAHPQFDAAAIVAQTRMDEIQGTGNVWYAGAWQRYGFHEDGLWSAVRVAQKLGVQPAWATL